MRDDLLERYNAELAFLRRTGAEFAKQYPKVAARLQLEPTKCEDPHVERLLEGFAFLAARVQLRIEDDFSEFSEGLLDIAYPQFVRPIPSMALVEFELDPEQGKLTTGYRIPRGRLLESRPLSRPRDAGDRGAPPPDQRCRFRTCYDTTLWPIRVADAKFLAPHELSPPVRAPDATAALRVRLECAPDVKLGELSIDRLRVHLRAEPELAATLYEVLCNNVVRVLVRDPDAKNRDAAVLPADTIQPVGFAEDEGVLPTPRRSFVGYRLLQEYFTFPSKFLFLDITRFDEIRAACPGGRAELIFLISPFGRPERRDSLENGVTKDTLRPGCTPVINLFPLTTEPIQLDGRRQEYVVVPDVRRRAWTGAYSIESVVLTSQRTDVTMPLEPFHSFRHRDEDGAMFWSARRRPARWRTDQGTDLYLSFVDLSSRVVQPDADAVTVGLVCHNYDLPARLPFGSAGGDLQMEGGGPLRSIRVLGKPTDPIHPPLGKPQLWRLISTLSLNYTSLVDGNADTLRELLRLYNFGGSSSAERQIDGVRQVAGEPCYARIEGEHGLTFARGHRVTVDFDEEAFVGGGVYLLASVLERFLGLYVSMNSFTILAAQSAQRPDPIRAWPPRSGWKALL